MKFSIKDMSLTAMFLALGIIFSYISNFIPFFTFSFLKIDISIVFILIPISIIGYRYSFFIAIVIGLSNLAWSNTGFIGPIILIVSNTSFLLFYFIFDKIMKFKKSKLIKISFSIIINAIFLSIINGILFTPIFIYMFTDIKTISFIEISQNYNNGILYEKLKWFLMFIPDYWSGIFALYISLNILKFSIGGILFLSIDRILFKNDITYI